MLTVEQFKKLCGVEKIQLYKGKGREFGQTPIGKVFAAKDINWQKQVFVVENDGSKNPALKGTYWFVNSVVTATTEL